MHGTSRYQVQALPMLGKTSLRRIQGRTSAAVGVGPATLNPICVRTVVRRIARPRPIGTIHPRRRLVAMPVLAPPSICRRVRQMQGPTLRTSELPASRMAIVSRRIRMRSCVGHHDWEGLHLTTFHRQHFYSLPTQSAKPVRKATDRLTYTVKSADVIRGTIKQRRRRSRSITIPCTYLHLEASGKI